VEIVCPVKNHDNERFSKIIPILANQGVTAVEIPLNYPDDFDYKNEKDMRALIKACRLSGIRINTVHAPFGPEYDISSLDDKVHEKGVDGLLESIEFANIVECNKIIVHSSYRLNDDRKKRLDRAKGVLKELAVVAKESNILIAIENLPPNYIGNTFQELLSIINHIDSPSASICFDCGHANMLGEFTEYTKQLLPYASVTHIHDNDGTEDSHLFPGLGNINWKEFWAEYIRIDCGASISLECLPQPHETWIDAFQKIRRIFGA
jgi:sugar phosphate isomerase/epimerase